MAAGSPVKVAFPAGDDDVVPRFLERCQAIEPGLPLYVFSEFPPADGSLRWIPYHPARSFRENFALCRAAVAGKQVRFSFVLLQPDTPFRRMRCIALLLAPRGFAAFNENLDHWMLRPRSAGNIARHVWWRASNRIRSLGLPSRAALSRAALYVKGAGVTVAKLLVSPFHGAADSRQPAAMRLRVPAELEQDPRLPALREAFTAIPNLFAATLAPPGREAVRGECRSYVLHGAAGATVFDAAKVEALGGARDLPTLDLCYRAWMRGWPTVWIPAPDAKPVVEGDRRAFLMRSVQEAKTFWRLWCDSIRGGPLRLPLASCEAAVFAGRAFHADRTTILWATPYDPFPPLHGGAIRVTELLRRAAQRHNIVLVAFTANLSPPTAEALSLCTEVVQVRRAGSHLRPTRDRPDMVEEFDIPAYRWVLRQTAAKWKPSVAMLECTHMAQFAAECRPARTALVEQDITFDFYRQLDALTASRDWEIAHQLPRWRRFETAAWGEVDAVVTMSDADAQLVTAGNAFTIPNGVDLDYYQPCADAPEAPPRVLFVGPFAHLPNLLAARFFLNEIWPKIAAAHPSAVFHLVAGRGYREHWARHAHDDAPALLEPRQGIAIDEYLPDLREAYRRATVVVAPLLASAGTKLKILEAMAAGKAVVATPAAVRGLDLDSPHDVIVAGEAAQFAARVVEVMEAAALRGRIERQGRLTVERRCGWDRMAELQEALFERLTALPAGSARSSSSDRSAGETPSQ